MLAKSIQNDKINQLSEQYLDELQTQQSARIDKIFRILLLCEWLFGIVVALFISPLTWAGSESSIHLHVWTALLLGGVIILPPVALGFLKPGEKLTSYVISIAQILFGSLLIHLMGGRIEAHFYIFGSLAFIATYRNWRLLIPVTIIIALDHYIRGVYWPESVYGLITGSEWRWLEHAGWVIFEDIFLIVSIIQGRNDSKNIALQRARLEVHASNVENLVEERTRELLRGKAKLRTVLDHVTEGIITVQTSGKIITSNPAAWTMFESNEDELATKTLYDLLPGITGDQLDSFVEQTISSRGDVDFVAQKIAGQEFPVAIKVNKAIIEGEVVYIFLISDLTYQKEIEDQLAKEQATSVNSSKLAAIGEMAGGIAHEINTPLAAILLTSQTLKLELERDKWNKELFLNLATNIEKTSKRISKIINALRSFSRGSDHDPFSRANVVQIIDDALSLCREKLTLRGIDVQLSLPEHGVSDIECREAQIGQVLINLINNSKDAIEDLKEKWINIEVSIEADDVVIVFKDSGMGIDNKVQEKLFHPFYTTKGVGKGTGLGLSISNGIINEHGGSLRYDPSAERTTFIIRLPISQQHEDYDPFLGEEDILNQEGA